MIICRYPSELECLVATLATDVPEVIKYRNDKINKLKRTFVSAQDASRAKCQRTSLDIPKTDNQQIIQFNGKTLQNVHYNVINRSGSLMIARRERPSLVNSSPFNLSLLSVCSPAAAASSDKCGIERSDVELVHRVRSQAGVRGKLVLFKNMVTQPYATVVDSVRKLKVEVSLTRTGRQRPPALW